jgi:aminopeptidase N
LRLNGYKLTLKAIKLNEQILLEDAYAVDDTGLTIHKVPEQFKLEITTYIEPQNNTVLFR